MDINEAISLVTAEDVRAFLQITGSQNEHDAVITILINAVSKKFNAFTNRILKETTYTDAYIDGSGQKTVNIPQYPISSLTDLYYDDELFTEGIDEDYILYGDEGYIYKTAGVWARSPKVIKITSYDAGYAEGSLPEDLYLAALKQILWEFQKYDKRDFGESARSFEGGSVTLITDPILPEVEAVLTQYRNLG